ncbi:restriction endonuclease [Demequina sp. SYSU T00068]|uniref:restriction endonuclease n=1 Tax=Demequina lignilytica TaxID=3051663 RepID=UPI00260A575A|nr:restriction endonuclease [Demequina sp. SYSU T00068]MDN4489258.1 restriction endonuclease [Demequina sp. SYSU T00068]
MTDIPKFHEYFAPALRVLSSTSPMRSRDITTAVADLLELTDEQRAGRIPSGQNRLDNRVNWALSYLYHARAVSKPQRGVFSIAERGRDLLARYPDGFGLSALETYEEFREFKAKANSRATDSPASSLSTDAESSPLELAADATEQLNREVAADLVQRIREAAPDFLERTLLTLFSRMGYGGTAGALEHTGGVHDGGFDGVINQDRLGIDRIYIQAKRYADGNTIGRPDVQGFLGALHHAGASGGIFVTTSDFSSGAREFAASAKPRVVLINGKELGELLVEHGVGVQERQTFTVVEVDDDFFE